MRASRPLTALLLIATAACGEKSIADGATGGTLIVSTASDADALVPPLIQAVAGKQIADQIFEYLADIGADRNTVGTAGFTPRLASSWEFAADSLSIAFHLNPKARWHDGRAVRAQDVRFSHQLYVNPAIASMHADAFSNIDSISVADSLTAVVWFKARQPTQFFEVAYNLAIMPEHLLKDIAPADVRSSAFARSPIGSGPFRFSRWESKALIEVVADTAHYWGRPKLDRIIWSVNPDPTTAVTKVLAGEADLSEAVRDDALERVKNVPTLRAFTYPGATYGALQFNLKDPSGKGPNPIFGDRGTRIALAMAIDRVSLVRNVLDTLGVVAKGPFTSALSTADSTITQIPFDTAGSRRMLDSLGWRDGNGDGVRERRGVPLAFTLLLPSSSSIRVRASVLLQEQFRAVGAKVTVEQMDIAALGERMTGRKYDAFLNAWVIDANPGSVQQAWSTAASQSKGGGNFSSYENPVFDAIVDSAGREFDLTKSKALYRRAYEMLVADAPAVFLYELRNTMAVSKRFQTSGIRADAWWTELYKWSVDPAQRIERDRMGAK